MKLTKRSLTMVIAIVLCAVTAIGGTFAYLTDTTEEAKNVFTVGNVKIEQTENFEQNAVLSPGLEVIKEVTVTNTGYTPAYVRTLVSFEMGDMSNEDFVKYINWSYNSKDWTQGTPYVDEVTADEATSGKPAGRYYVVPFIYNEVLEANETTSASLQTVLLSGDAGSKQLEELTDENNQYSIFVLSQAVQTNGFTSPDEALKAAFDAFNLEAELRAANKGGHVKIPTGAYSFENDVETKGTMVIPSGSQVTLDLKDKELTSNGTDDINTIEVEEGGTLIIKNGKISNDADAAVVNNGGTLQLEHCSISNAGTTDYAVVLNSGTTTMTNCTVNSLRGGIGIAEGAKLTATGGSVTARDYYPLYMTGGTADFDNTSFVRENQSKARYMIYRSGNVSAEFDNCSFTSKRPATSEQTTLANSYTSLTFTNCTYSNLDYTGLE